MLLEQQQKYLKNFDRNFFPTYYKYTQGIIRAICLYEYKCRTFDNEINHLNGCLAKIST